MLSLGKFTYFKKLEILWNKKKYFKIVHSIFLHVGYVLNYASTHWRLCQPCQNWYHLQSRKETIFSVIPRSEWLCQLSEKYARKCLESKISLTYSSLPRGKNVPSRWCLLLELEASPVEGTQLQQKDNKGEKGRANQKKVLTIINN